MRRHVEYGAWLMLSTLALVPSACASPPPIASCQDSLTGVWLADDPDARAPSGERWAFHVLDAGEHIEIYPRFDDSRPPARLVAHDADADADDATWWTPGMFKLRRIGKTLVGDRIVRLRRAQRACSITVQAAIRTCHKDAIELSWTEITRIDWRTCTAASASRFTRVSLTRQTH